jgi:uncharacterized membrane protein YebE (DUF533 family)
MKVYRPQEKPPTPEETKELEKLKAMIDQALEDGKITHDEVERIRGEIAASHPTTDQLHRSLELYRKFIADKLANGEVPYEFD